VSRRNEPSAAGLPVRSRQVLGASRADRGQTRPQEPSRTLTPRAREPAHLPGRQVQDAIDAVLFRCYGLSEDDARYIDQRLKEML